MVFDYYKLEVYFEDMLIETWAVAEYKEVDFEEEPLNYSKEIDYMSGSLIGPFEIVPLEVGLVVDMVVVPLEVG